MGCKRPCATEDARRNATPYRATLRTRCVRHETLDVSHILAHLPSSPSPQSTFDENKRDVVEKIGDSRRKKWQSSMREPKIDALDQSPYFTHHVKDLYFKFVDQTAKLVKEKCMDEFLSTRTIYWDLTEYPLSLLNFVFNFIINFTIKKTSRPQHAHLQKPRRHQDSRGRPLQATLRHSSRSNHEKRPSQVLQLLFGPHVC
jgi:hypothetical protein